MNGFIARKEVTNLIDISAKDVNAPEFLNKPGFETGQVGDVVKDPLLCNGMAWRVRTSLEGSSQLVRVNPFRVEDSQG